TEVQARSARIAAATAAEHPATAGLTEQVDFDAVDLVLAHHRLVLGAVVPIRHRTSRAIEIVVVEVGEVPGRIQVADHLAAPRATPVLTGEQAPVSHFERVLAAAEGPADRHFETADHPAGDAAAVRQHHLVGPGV